jgi:carboxyl-terminal processing protease
LHTRKTEYKASSKGLFEQGKLAILVDEGSASASEILAGAVQDWDRGAVIGRRSFGKGLVQEQYEMPDGAALRLTIAKYYTPSGRCIQRSFAKGRDAYLEDYQKRVESDVVTGKDTIATTDTMRFFTANHRIVYGGGGITPDVFVPYDTVHTNTALMALILQSDLRTTIWDYYTHNREKLKYKDMAEFNASFSGEPQIENDYLATLRPEIKRAALILLSRPANHAFFTLQIRAQVARLLFRDNGYYAVTLKDDAVVNKALAVMASAEYSKIVGGK